MENWPEPTRHHESYKVLEYLFTIPKSKKLHNCSIIEFESKTATE
jgi:hypothetical protein